VLETHIYLSDSAPVLPIPANLWKVVPPADVNATIAVRPNGAFFVITFLWQCGSTIIESGISNPVSVAGGPTVTGLKVTGKLKALGNGFTDGVLIYVNDVAFARQAVVADSTLVIQKGTLSDGTAISALGATGPVLITFKNPDGGLGSFTFTRH
jgi:hypothetical protein